ncbi:MAG: hypothetical protein IJ813_03385 [Bacteroidales bacterium]|nr:hypothetical protein [Bacteroidales bacterium]
MKPLPIILAISAVFSMASCMKIDDSMSLPGGGNSQKKVGFDINVTREGQAIPSGRRARMNTKGADVSDPGEATMSSDIPFGLIGIDYEHGALVIDNESVYSTGDSYGMFMDSMMWDELNTKNVTFSAYYPYVHNVSYEDNLEAYSIPYSVEETSAGPLVSKTVEMAVAQMNMIPLEFQHITNDIGYCICDVTPDPQLQGLIHLRKLVAHNVASAGVFVNDVTLSQGIWHRQGYYRKVVVFEGDAKVGVGSENEKFVGYDTLEDRMADSHRYYSIPDEIEVGKQFVEVFFDVEGFTLNGFYYEPLEHKQAKYMLYGLLPDNVFVYGRQYTFHIGLDLSKVYSEITFAPTVSGWETKIYENNDNF